MSDRTCPHVRGAHLLLLTAFAPLLVVSKADGQSPTVNETAVSRTQAAMYVFEKCGPRNNDSLEACDEDAAAAVTRFVDTLNLDGIPSRRDIEKAFDKVVQEEAISGRGGQDSAGRESAPSSTGGGGFAGLSFPVAAFAVTDFLVERAKAELVHSTFLKIADSVRTGDLRMLLPKSRNVLNGASELSYRALMPTFRAAVKEDFRALPRNLSVYVDSTSSVTIPDGIRLLSAVGDAFMRLESGTDVLIIMSELEGLDVPWEKERHRQGLQLFSRFAKEFAEEFRATRGFAYANPGWSFLDSLLSDHRTAKVFSAFILGDMQEADDVQVPADVQDRLAEVRDLAVELAGLVDVIEPRVSRSGEQVAPNRTSVAGRIASVFQTAVPLLLASDTPAAARDSTVKSFRAEIALAHTLWTAIEAREYHRIVALVVNRLADLVENSAIPRRLLSFAASVASAEDAEDLEEALEALADPVGSFRSRRVHNALNLSLVSYVGMGIGGERTDFDDRSESFLGAFAPIGVELSWGTGWGSIGIMGSLVDLGTLVSYRFNETDVTMNDGTRDTVDALPEVNLQHVFSPAFSVVLGVTKSLPLSLGGTWQLAPRLRTLRGADEQLTAVRLSGFLAIDLTLLRF